MGLFGGSNNGKDAAMMSALIQLQGQTAAMDALKPAYERARSGLTSKDYYAPYAESGEAANSLYSNALGLGGADGNRAATAAFQTSPGYQFAVDQGTQALNRNAASRGMLASGNQSIALQDYGQKMATQEYGNWLNRLAQLGSQGLTAASGETGRQNTLANLDYGYGTGQAGIFTGTTKSVGDTLYKGAMDDAAANAQGGANLFSGILGGLSLVPKFAALSDENEKTDIQEVGKDKESGLTLYAYRYKGDPKSYPKVVGPMAQEVEKKFPHRVEKIAGKRIIKAA